MPDISTVLLVILLIIIVLTIFNIIIFVHELGHFLAAKWCGLRIDRFQIWFGTPIWKKEINGVQYGLGWIPAGGFVALPQMAPMEALEGGNKDDKPLPAITPLDKIIVAFAGPLFSMMLALASAVVVWQVGKPKDFVDTQEIGYVEPGSQADKAGLKAGDRIIEINGKAVNGFAGSLNSISESIILSRGDKIRYLVDRPGESKPLALESGFEKDSTGFFQRLFSFKRSELRNVGIDNAGPVIIGSITPKSPAAKAGLQLGERILSVDGIQLHSSIQFIKYVGGKGEQAVMLDVENKDHAKRQVQLTPLRPIQPKDSKPKIGIGFDTSSEVDTRIVNPEPLLQVKDSLQMMWITITGVLAKDSSISADHLSGPVGIATMQYHLLQMEDGWRRILAFMVLFNVNLAVLNMMPFPVLDGGHIVLAILEKIFGRPVKAKPLEILQTVCALALISLMLFVTSKDIGDKFGHGPDAGSEVVFP